MTDFTTSTGTLRQVSRSADGLAAELRSVRGSWARATDNPGEALGYAELDQAYRAAQDGWFDELGVYVEVLAEAAGSLLGNAQEYESTEDNNQRRFSAGAL